MSEADSNKHPDELAFYGLIDMSSINPIGDHEGRFIVFDAFLSSAIEKIKKSTLANDGSASNLKCNTCQEVMCCDGKEIRTPQHRGTDDDSVWA